MSKRSTNLNRGHTTRLNAQTVGDLAAELGLTLDDLYPMFDLLLPDDSIVQQRGANGVDASVRYYRQHGVRPAGYRKARP